MKKKITLLKVFMTLCLLLVGIGNAWGEDETWSYTVTTNSPTFNSENPVTINEASWSIVMGEKVGEPSTNGMPTNSYSSCGWKWGNNGSNYWKSYTLSTDYFTDKKVKSVTVNFLNNGKKSGTMTVTQGSTTIGSQTKEFSNPWTDLTANTTTGSGGTLSINYTVEQASYIHSISVTYESAPVAVEAPTFSPAETEFLESTSVSLTCATEGAAIYYTLDGTEPTKTSTQYTETINISETTTIKAIAYKGDDASNVATKTYTKIVPLTTMDAIFNASATAGNYWITFNNWVVSGVKNSNAYITDNAGKGLIVYKSGHGFAAGDILSGTVKCALTRYNGSAEITDLTSSAAGLTVTKGGTLNTIDATIANLGGVNTGAYINLGALTYNGTEFTDGINTIKPYNTFMTLPTLINGKKYYVKGIYIQYDTKEIAPLDATDFAEVPATEYNITITPCENGSVTVDAEENKAQEGQVVTLTITPNAHYALSTLSVTDASLNPITVTDDYKFTMPASDVRVNATFAEIPTHAAKFFVNGVQYGETQLVLEGGEVEFPEEDPAAIGTRTFVGWTASQMPSASDEAPEFVESATMGTKDLNFYAVYAKKTEGDGNYEKVTTAPADWCGKYLIVYETETDKLAFDGSLTTLDAVGNTKEVTISNNIIASSEAMDAIAFTVAYKTGSSTVYSLKSASGYYISGTVASNKASNGLKQADTDEDYEISFDGITLQSKSSDQQMLLRYNKASDQKRFRFFKSGQQEIALYKKHEATYSGYCTLAPVTATITSTGYATFSCDYKLDLDKLPEGLKAYFATYNESTKAIHMEEATGKVPAKTGLFLGGNKSAQYEIPVTADDAVTPVNNILKPTGEEDLVKGDFVYYINLEKFCPITNETLTLSAGKAYIPKAEIPAEGPVSIVFGGEITGIEGAGLTPALSTREGVIYNLQGMRVTTPKKGEVYIMNGKKCIMK